MTAASSWGVTPPTALAIFAPSNLASATPGRAIARRSAARLRRGKSPTDRLREIFRRAVVLHRLKPPPGSSHHQGREGRRQINGQPARYDPSLNECGVLSEEVAWEKLECASDSFNLEIRTPSGAVNVACHRRERRGVGVLGCSSCGGSEARSCRPRPGRHASRAPQRRDRSRPHVRRRRRSWLSVRCE